MLRIASRLLPAFESYDTQVILVRIQELAKRAREPTEALLPTSAIRTLLADHGWAASSREPAATGAFAHSALQLILTRELGRR